MTLRLPPIVAGSPFAHRAPDITAVRLLVCAAPESQAETLLAHLGEEALMGLLTEATEGDGYVDIKHAPVRYTLNLQKRTETTIERFGLTGQLFGLPGRDLAFVVERVQPDPDPSKDAGDVLTLEVATPGPGRPGLCQPRAAMARLAGRAGRPPLRGRDGGRDLQQV